jgi:hypothetical protein
MRHLQPSLLASLADGAAVSADARAHLKACAACREELEALRGLTEALAEAPAPPAALRAATLQRLGIRPSRQRGLWRWAWAPLALAGAAAFLLWQQPARAPQLAQAPAAAAPSTLDLASVPHPRRAPRSAAEAREQLQDAAIAQKPAPAPSAPAKETAPAVGAASPAPPVETTHLESSPKETPTPAPVGMRVSVRNNLIKNGAALTLTIDLPSGSQLLARVFDERGRSVETLYQGPAGPGSVNLHWDAQGAASGAYTVLLQSGGSTRKVQAIVAR